MYNSYILLAIIFYVLSYGYYLKISHGLGNKATYLQMRRFVPCAILAVLPAAVTQLPLSSPLFVIPTIICWLWILTYPTLYYISNHKVSSDFEFHFEAVFGLYIISWISALGILIQQIPGLALPAAVIITVLEVILMLVPLAQLGYFFLYKACINENGMQMLQETHYNEIIEYFKSLPLACNLFSTLGVVLMMGVCGWANYGALTQTQPLSLYSVAILAAIVAFLTCYLWKKKHGVFIRTAIVEFYLDVKTYLETNKLYKSNMRERVKNLTVQPLAEKFAKPSTILLVIGESASRDYMQAFNTHYPHNTTPWLNTLKETPNCIIFPNAYSSCANTVVAVSNALTEINQYNDKKFYEACSIIDVVRALGGYSVHWYSNQGHLGCADTPVTLIADTADVAKWTKQKLNTVQYDESLLDFLDEVDPQSNNFVVIHLKGSHFNFLNRYPEAFTKFGTPGKYELELNYANTIAYTDYVLSKIFAYAQEKLNLQAMVYFSDHAVVPDRRRSPNFEGFGCMRIPLVTYFSDEYIAKNKNVVETLREHQNLYWTNDLAYELLCSVFNVQSNKFDETNSLASPKFKYRREDLLTNVGRTHI